MQKKNLWMQVLSMPIMIFILVTPELIYAQEDTEGEVVVAADSDDVLLGTESSFNKQDELLAFVKNVDVFIQNILELKVLCEYGNFKEEYVQGVCDAGFLEVFKDSMSYRADKQCNEVTFRKQCKYLLEDAVGEKTRLGTLYDAIADTFSKEGLPADKNIYKKFYYYRVEEGFEREIKDDLNKGDSNFVDLYAASLVNLNQFLSKYRDILIQYKKIKDVDGEIIVDMRKDFYGTKKVTKKAERAKRKPRTIV